MNSKSKRSYFTEADTHRLVDIVQSRKNIIECKKTDATTWKENADAWDQIAVEYNASCTEKKTASQLRCKFDNLKKDLRKFEANRRMSLYKTGGGEGDPEIKPSLKLLYDKLSEIVSSMSIVGLDPVVGDGDMIEPGIGYTGDLHMAQVENVPVEIATGSENTFVDPIIIIDEIVRADDIPNLEEETPKKDWSKYTPKLLKSRKDKVLQTNSRRRTAMEDNSSNSKDVKAELVQLKKDALIKEEQRNERHHLLLMKQEEELHKLRVENQCLQNEKLRLELELLKKQLNN